MTFTKNKILLFGLLAIVSFCCNKKEVKPSLKKYVCLLEKSEADHYITSYGYNYDGKLAYLGNKNEFQGFYESFYYTYPQTGKVFIKEEKELFEAELTLNEDNNVIKRKETTYTSRNPDKIYNTKFLTYIYNIDGYIIRKIESSVDDTTQASYITEYTIEDGNIVKEKITDWRKKESTITYTYFTDMDNLFAETIRRSQFTGTQTRNIVKTKEETLSGQSPVLYDFSYSKDYNDNIDTMIMTQKFDNTITEYKWKCGFEE